MKTLAPQHYRPTIATHLNTVDRINNAYRAGGLESPSRASDLEKLLDAEPTADDVAHNLAGEALTVTDPANWLEQALTSIARAHAADALRTGLGRHREQTLRARTKEMAAAAVTDLQPAFSKAAQALAKAAASLPAGSDPLDLAAVVQADATRAMKAAQSALTTLAAMASIHELPTATEIHAATLRLLPVIDVPEVPVEQVSRLTGVPVEEAHPERENVRRLGREAAKYGEDAALIAVSRGEYGPNVTLALAKDRAELLTRVTRTRDAHRRIRTDVGPRAVVL